MKDSTVEDVVIVATLALGWALATIARSLLLPLVALVLTLAGWKPAPAMPAAVTVEHTPKAPTAPPAARLAGLKVAELRTMARVAGLPKLARHGRKAELLVALALAGP